MLSTVPVALYVLIKIQDGIQVYMAEGEVITFLDAAVTNKWHAPSQLWWRAENCPARPSPSTPCRLTPF